MKALIFYSICTIIYANSFCQGTLSTVYSFEFTSLSGNTPIKLSDYAGKKLLIVNVAFESDSISQLRAFVSAFKKKEEGNSVLFLCPSNSFNHENGSIEVLRKKYSGLESRNIRVTAPVDVKGPNSAPIFKWLASSAMNGVMNASVNGDFNKFLINEEGVLVAFIGISETSESPIMKKLLGF